LRELGAIRSGIDAVCIDTKSTKLEEAALLDPAGYQAVDGSGCGGGVIGGGGVSCILT